MTEINLKTELETALTVVEIDLYEQLDRINDRTVELTLRAPDLSPALMKATREVRQQNRLRAAKLATLMLKLQDLIAILEDDK